VAKRRTDPKAAGRVTSTPGPSPEPDDAPRLSAQTKTLYGVGCVVDGVSTTALTYFALFYFTAVCGLPGALAGVAVFIGLMVDSVVDPLIGLLSDNTRSPLGRRHVYMLASLAPLAIAFGLLFSIPPLKGISLFGYITLVSIATRVLLSFFNLPFYALGAEMSDDYAERTSVVAFRVSFLMAASLACLAIGLGGFLGGSGGLLNRAAYPWFGWTCALLMAVCGLLSFAGTRRFIPRLHQAGAVDGPVLARFVREAREVATNRSFVVLFLSCLAFFVAQGVSGALTLYANKYFWNLPDGDTRLVVLCVSLGPVLGVPAAAIAARRFEKRAIATAGLGLFAVTMAALPLLRVLGLLPFSGGTLVAILLGNAVMVGGALTLGAISFQAMIADAADEHEHRFGVRREGLFFAGLTLAVKAATGVGSLVAGVTLDLIGFPTAQIAAHAPYRLSHAVVERLGLIAGPLPALFALASPLVLLGYRLTASRLASLQRDLRQAALARAAL
jgi:GPH family glycoside/pentoside/hexuronide:cation symporter